MTDTASYDSHVDQSPIKVLGERARTNLQLDDDWIFDGLKLSIKPDLELAIERIDDEPELSDAERWQALMVAMSTMKNESLPDNGCIAFLYRTNDDGEIIERRNSITRLW